MPERRWGPTQAAGTVVKEKDTEKTIQAAPFGVICYTGIVEKGDPTKLIRCGKRTNFERRCGTYLAESLLPDCAFDFYKHGEGAGEVYVKRITDGTEVKSTLLLYNRRGTTIFETDAVIRCTAKSGGAWAGQRKILVAELDSIGDLTETTLQIDGITPGAYPVNFWRGGQLKLDAVTTKTYTIESNDEDGLVTVNADATMLTDHGGGGNLLFDLELPNIKYLSCIVRDGIENPDSEFGLYFYDQEGALLDQYPDLSMDPAASNYFVNIVNNDAANFEVEVTDLWSPNAPAADSRPTNFWLAPTEAVTANTLTVDITPFVVAGTGDGSATPITYDDLTVRAGTLVLTCTDVSTPGSEVWSVAYGGGHPLEGTTLADATTAVAYASLGDRGIDFTVTVGGTAWALTDTITFNITPLGWPTSDLAGGFLFPDVDNAPTVKAEITEITADTLTTRVGVDLTDAGAIADRIRVEAPQQCGGGHHGHGNVIANDYIAALDPNTSLINRLRGQNKGLVKLGCPGVNDASVQKAGAAYAEARNYQYRYEYASGLTTEESAVAELQNNIGRNDMAVSAWPSYAYVNDPESRVAGALKLVPVTGMIHGREAKQARTYDGYHQPAAGVFVTLPTIVKSTIEDDYQIDEELLNPKGIAIILKKSGNWVIWGDRTNSLDPGWKWKHQREQMSYYELVLLEAFDWIIFLLQDTNTRALAIAALRSFFEPEWAPKGALAGTTFEEACQIKVDDEINTPVTEEAGDLLAAVSLKFKGVVERFIIIMSKRGIFETIE